MNLLLIQLQAHLEQHPEWVNASGVHLDWDGTLHIYGRHPLFEGVSGDGGVQLYMRYDSLQDFLTEWGLRTVAELQGITTWQLLAYFEYGVAELICSVHEERDALFFRCSNRQFFFRTEGVGDPWVAMRWGGTGPLELLAFTRLYFDCMELELN